MAGSSNDFSHGGDISRGDFFSWLKISVIAIWKYRVKGSLNLRSETFPVCVLFFFGNIGKMDRFSCFPCS